MSVHVYFVTHMYFPLVYFHVCASMRSVLPWVCFHESCTLYHTSQHGPCKHVMGMHCSIVVVPTKITRVKVKLHLSATLDTVYNKRTVYVCSNHATGDLILIAVDQKEREPVAFIF